MKKYLILLLIIFALPVSAALNSNSNAKPADILSSLSIDEEGLITVKGAVISQAADNTFFAKINWNQSYIRLILRTDDKTKFKKRYGGDINYKDIAVGHYVDVTGELYGEGEALNIIVKEFRDLSLQKENSNVMSGVLGDRKTVTTFIFNPKNGSSITLQIHPAAKIKKGSIYVTASDLKKGDRILSATGIYNFENKSLEADNIVVYQDMSIFVPKAYEGKLKSVDANTLPATAVLSALNGKEYKVNLFGAGKTEVINKARKAVSFARFVVGDHIRIWGVIREENHLEIDAEVIRNMEL